MINNNTLFNVEVRMISKGGLTEESVVIFTIMNLSPHEEYCRCSFWIAIPVYGIVRPGINTIHSDKTEWTSVQCNTWISNPFK